jgi:glycosyltransferase involved in cell wall biosynthesis
MRVLFLMFAFPDMNHSFNMYTALVEQFYKNGHQVFVVAPETADRKTSIRKENGIDVLRVYTLPIKNVSHYLKGVSNVLLPFQFGRAIKKFYPKVKFDLILTPTPPITLVDLAFSLKRKHHAIHYLMLRDIFPQNAVDLGFMKKNGIIYRYFKEKEKRLYASADLIGCMSQGNINFMLSNNKHVPEDKLHELKNFQKPYNNRKLDHMKLRKQYGLENKFVVVFGGNMGKPQQLENVLMLAEMAEGHKDIVVLLLGEGVKMDEIARLIEKNHIKNILIQRTIPKHEYQDLISVCDVGLISLHESFTIPNIPSKALDYWNVGLPILASIDKATDFGKILDDEKCGLWSYAGEHEKFYSNLMILYHNKNSRLEMGKKGKAYFSKYLTPDLAYKTIIDKLN